MKKIIISAVLIAGIVAAFFYFFVPKDSTKEDLIKDLESKKASFENVGKYFTKHTELTRNFVYIQDSAQYPEIKEDIKKVLDKDFLYIGFDDDHKEVVFGTASQSTSDDHKLIYSPFDKPKSEPDAQVTKYGVWYTKM